MVSTSAISPCLAQREPDGKHCRGRHRLRSFQRRTLPFINEGHNLIAPINFLPGYALSLSTAQGVAMAVILLTIVINNYGCSGGKLIGNVFTLAKLTGMVALLVVGLYAFWLHPAILHANFAHPWTQNDVLRVDKGPQPTPQSPPVQSLKANERRRRALSSSRL